MQGTAKTVVVLPVVLADNDEVSTAKYVSLLTYKDEVKPEIASVESKTSGTVATSVKVIASEPIQSATAKIDGEARVINFNGTNEATVTGLSLDASKTHKIELLNLTDKAGNVTISTSKEFSVTVDKTAPTAQVSADGDNAILVEFNKDMDVNTVTAAFAADTNVKDEVLSNVNHSAIAQVDGSAKKFRITLNDANLYQNKTSRVLTVAFPETVKDSLGNAIAPTTKQVILTKDTAKPVYTSYKIKRDSDGKVTAIEFNFNEALSAKVAASITPTIVKENGEAISAANLLGGLSNAAVTAGDKKVVFNATTPAKLSGKYTFTFGANAVTDSALTPNGNDAFTTTVDFGAAEASQFTLANGAVTSPAANQYEVNFGRAVKGGNVAGSATDLANYTLGGKALPTGTTIVLKEGTSQQVAVITLPANSIDKSDANAVFTVSNVQSQAGDVVNFYSQTVAVVDNVKPVLTSAVLTGDNKLSIGFSESLATGPVAGDLVVKINGKTLIAVGSHTLTVSAGTGSDSGKYLLNLDAFVKQGSPAVPAQPEVEAQDATPTYIDVNNNNQYDAGTDIKIADGPVANFTFTSSPVITSVTVSTLATGDSTAKDAADNGLVNGTTITVK